MVETINWLFDEFFPKLWEIIGSNIYTAFSIMLSLIAMVIAIHKNTKQ